MITALGGTPRRGNKHIAQGSALGEADARCNHALKGQKLMIMTRGMCSAIGAVALTGRRKPCNPVTQGVALGWKPFALSGRWLRRPWVLPPSGSWKPFAL